jgi:type IV pilus assembly protein PilN
MNMFLPSDLNLATQPFRRERAHNAALAAACAALLATLVLLITLVLHARVQAKDLRQTIQTRQAELRRMQDSSSQYSSVLSKPANAGVFSESVLLNELIARRSVSWTRVFGDLGTVLPSNVRLLSIRLPQVAAGETAGKDRVQLDMWVGTDQPAAVITLLKNLEGSKLFGDASVMTQAPPTQNDPLFKYRLTVAYAQRL